MTFQDVDSVVVELQATDTDQNSNLFFRLDPTVQTNSLQSPFSFEANILVLKFGLDREALDEYVLDCVVEDLNADENVQTATG